MPQLTPEQVKGSLSGEQYKLYKLIWERFIASQMANAELDTMSEKPSIAACKNASWATTYNSFKKRLDSKLEDLVSSLF